VTITARPAIGVSNNSPEIAAARTQDHLSVGPTPPPERPLSPAFHFSTLALPAHRQFAAWRDCFGSSILDLTRLEQPNEGFAGEHVVWDLGSFALGHFKADAERVTRRAQHVRRDSLDHWMIDLILKGSYITSAASREFDGSAGSVHVHFLGHEFDSRVSKLESLKMWVPRDFCRDTAHLLDAAAFSTVEGGMGRLMADYMVSLARQLPTLDAADAPRLATATRAMILACVAPSPDKLEEAREPITAVLLERARRFVQTNLFNPDLDATTMQRELGMSRSKLYRLFESSGGVARYIQHRRLLDAHAALADTDNRLRIVDIAEQHGFNDGAEFSRAFRREFGYSPSEVRAGMMEGPPSRPSSDLQVALPGERLGLLIRRLRLQSPPR
jgi:AraC-like DNA-binding protein